MSSKLPAFYSKLPICTKCIQIAAKFISVCFFTLAIEKNLTLPSLSPRVRFFEGVAMISYISQFFFLSITLCTPTSLSIFLILFSRHFLWTDKETFFNNQSFLGWKLFPFSIDHNEWFSSINLVINRITWWLLLWVKEFTDYLPYCFTF